MEKLDHKYQIYPYKRILVVLNLDLGNHPVVSKIDKVLKQIGSDAKIFISDYKVIYKDSKGLWNGYDILNNRFILFQKVHKADALTAIKNI